MQDFKEDMAVVLLTDKSDYGLRAGTLGTIIVMSPHVPGRALVEFSGTDGVPYAELDLPLEELLAVHMEPVQAVGVQ